MQKLIYVAAVSIMTQYLIATNLLHLKFKWSLFLPFFFFNNFWSFHLPAQSQMYLQSSAVSCWLAYHVRHSEEAQQRKNALLSHDFNLSLVWRILIWSTTTVLNWSEKNKPKKNEHSIVEWVCFKRNVSLFSSINSSQHVSFVSI